MLQNRGSKNKNKGELVNRMTDLTLETPTKRVYNMNEELDLQGAYPLQYMNKMSLEAFSSERFYLFNPKQYASWVQQQNENPTFPTTVYLEFEEGFLAGLSGENVAYMFSEYGDFYLQKVNDSACFIEFFQIDAAAVPGKKLSTFMELVKAKADFRIVNATDHKDAPPFKAHDVIDER